MSDTEKIELLRAALAATWPKLATLRDRELVDAALSATASSPRQ